MNVTIWGCRGSIACPGKDTIKYGGNTTCIEVRNNNDDVLVLDSGSGIRLLGEKLVREGRKKIDLLISHTHWDHVSGFPFFVPIYIPGMEITTYGPPDMVNDKSLAGVVGYLLNYAYFPVRQEELNAKIEYIDHLGGQLPIETFKVTCRNMNHKILCLGSRIEADGKVFFFTGDHEPYVDFIYDPEDTSVEAQDARQFADAQNDLVAEAAKDADLLVCDCQYTDQDYKTKKGWGHSCISDALALGIKANVKKLVLTHHDPSRHDNDIDDMEAECKRRLKDMTSSPMEVSFAREQVTMEL